MNDSGIMKIIGVVMAVLDYDLYKECFLYIDEHDDGSEFHKKRESLLAMCKKELSK